MKFYTEHELKELPILMIVLSVFTFGLPLIFFYDYFITRHYCRNRITLHKILKNELYDSLTYSRTLGTINVYELVYDGETYSIWIWDNKDLSIYTDSVSDLIGLFVQSPYQRRLTSNMIKIINDKNLVK
jgi:hypothetical protein